MRLIPLSILSIFLGACGMFVGMDSSGYSFGLSLNDVSREHRFLSSLYVRGHSSMPVSVGLAYNRFLLEKPISIAPGGGVEVLIVGNSERKRVVGLGMEFSLEMVPYSMFRRGMRAGEGDFMWFYVRPYLNNGYNWDEGRIYWNAGIQAGFRIKQVYSY